MTVTIEIVDDPAHACAAMMVGVASAGGDIVLAGGSTPKAAYAQFVEAVSTVGVDIAQTTFWLGDERCVEPDDDRSNLKMLRASLLDPLAALGSGSQPGPTIHPIQGALGPQRGAEDYERQLADAGPPRFDLMLLGIGPDGHTLSLFPDQAALRENSRLAVGVPEAGHEPFVARVSMTWAAVALARQVVVLADGEGKADAIARAFAPGVAPTPSIPSSMLAAHAADLTVLIDPAAAAKLPAGADAS